MGFGFLRQSLTPYPRLDWYSLSSLGCPHASYVAQARLKLMAVLLFSFPSVGITSMRLQTRTTTAFGCLNLIPSTQVQKKCLRTFDPTSRNQQLYT